MQINHHQLKEAKLKILDLVTTTTKPSISAIFAEHHGDYIIEYQLYIAYFNRIPNCIKDTDIDIKKATLWFLKTYKEKIKESNYYKRYLQKVKKIDFEDAYYILYDDLLVYFDFGSSQFKLIFKNTEIELVEKLLKELQRFKKRNNYNKPLINLISICENDLCLTEMQINKPKLNINDNYNDDFLPINQTILKRLSKKNDKGIVLLHGKPGTGKTTYIRYLMASVRKKMIFLPPNMANTITNPGLIRLLVNNQNSILIIEDAENIIIDRKKNGDSPVSALLNISDGLLADCLNIQIICSFNTDISKIDTALMRKGRLIAKYEFKELETEKSQLLSSKLGFETIINSPMTLTAIYNQDEKEYHQLKKHTSIGFKTLKEQVI
jgi:energy-coupling factor transporter ATP-binding protein EcfA2